MLFEVTFTDGSVRKFQAHDKAQLEAVLQNVRFVKSVESRLAITFPGEVRSDPEWQKVLQEAGAARARGPKYQHEFHIRSAGGVGGMVAVTVLLVQSAFPQVVEVLKAWSQSRSNRHVKLKIERDGATLQLDITGSLPEAETQRMIRLVGELRKEL